MMNLIKNGKSIGRCFVLIISSLIILQIQSQWCAAQCLRFDKSRDVLFITYEQTAIVTRDGEKAKKGVLLRLHNNSTCTVIITTGSYEKFLKPLPKNPTFLQLAKREIEYDLPDGVLVPETQYLYFTSRGRVHSLGGDSFHEFNLLGKRSILFEVLLKDFDLAVDSKISLMFQYDWERKDQANYPSVENTVQFFGGELPDSVKQKIRKY